MTQDRTETAPHAAAAMDRLQLPNQDEMVPVAGPVEGEWWVDRITELEAHVARCEQIIHDQDAQLATPTPEPAPADPVAEAARVYIASKALHGPKWVQLRDAGLPIISTWIDESGVGETINWPGLWSRCISEASDCTHLIAYRELGEILKGAWAEVGAALAHGRKVILCGDFTEFSIKHHPNVTIWASSDIRTALRAITEASHAAD